MKLDTKDSKFLSHLCILTAVVTGASIAMRNSLTVWWPAILLFFFIVSILVYFLSMRARRKDMRKFANFYMASTVVKMILYLTIIFVYVLNFKEDGKRFAITFLIYYLIYSVFETFKLAKKEKKKIDGE
jgi:phosphatidylglycerophosphate synthase